MDDRFTYTFSQINLDGGIGFGDRDEAMEFWAAFKELVKKYDSPAFQGSEVTARLTERDQDGEVLRFETLDTL